MYIRQIIAIWSLRGLVMLWRDKYELWVLQKAAVGGYSGSNNGYNVGGYNSGGG